MKRKTAARLKELEGQYEAMCRAMSTLRLQIREQRLLQIQEEFGITIGSVVVSDGREYSITKIDPQYSLAWVMGVLICKDGTVGTRERNLFSNWHKGR